MSRAYRGAVLYSRAGVAMSKSTSDEFKWQKSRLKGPPKGGLMTRGYGPGGAYSLFLPSPRVTRKVEFHSGAATIIETGTCLDNPAIRAARDDVLKSQGLQDKPRIEEFLTALSADLALARYSAVCLAMFYNLSDDDLTLLHSGSHWQIPLLRHALGGEDAVDALNRLSPETTQRIRLDSERRYTALQLRTDGVPVETDAAVLDEVAAVIAAGEFDPTDL
jgi:hypothetical protein